MNKLIIACAGSGKTRYIVHDAIEKANQGYKVLITTYTLACEKEIKDKIIKENCAYIPSNITIQTWFSFLINHGVKPYLNYLFDFHIRGMELVKGTSGVKFINTKGIPICYKDSEERHYFNNRCQIFLDKVSKLAMKCNEHSGGKVVERLSSCFSFIYIAYCNSK